MTQRRKCCRPRFMRMLNPSGGDEIRVLINQGGRSASAPQDLRTGEASAERKPLPPWPRQASKLMTDKVHSRPRNIRIENKAGDDKKVPRIMKTEDNVGDDKKIP
ncbi:hypothetical protein ACH5RR_009548 [Cinchona calisaya]|uniref:Uncharacterized protein n=1 Tax=Cinchona calisaya TaxID=153742 RepID=A0ABD3AEL0_9GENT